MGRGLVILLALTGLAIAGYAGLYLAYGDFAKGVVVDGQRMAEWRRHVGAIGSDTCRYFLMVPADIDHPETPAFDTTIVRRSGCTSHWLKFPAQGTSTTYRLQRDTVVRELGFYTDDERRAQWLDISTLPTGAYHVTLLACSNGGGFTLHIK